MQHQNLLLLFIAIVALSVATVHAEGSCGEKTLLADSKPVWNETLFWPYNLGNRTVVGYNENGTVIYTGSNEAEICPSDHKKECCQCAKPDACDDTHVQNCPSGRRPCMFKYFCTLVNPEQQQHHHHHADDEEDTMEKAIAETPKEQVKELIKKEQPKSDSEPPIEPMTRTNILQRAVGWVAHSFPYAGNGVNECNFETCGENDTTNGCPSKRYISVCNGLVAMAWRVNNETPDDDSSYCVDCRKLLPGDGMHLESHWIMFLAWSPGKEMQQARVWQMGGGKGKANEDYYVIKQLHFCRRRKYIIGENVTDQVPCNSNGLENIEINKYSV